MTLATSLAQGRQCLAADRSDGGAALKKASGSTRAIIATSFTGFGLTPELSRGAARPKLWPR